MEVKRKYPVYRQYDSRDCGPACLRMIAKYYGKSYSMEFLKNRSVQRKTGTSLLGISDAAESIGFKTIGVKITFEQLCSIPCPCVVSWNQNHFVVVYKITRKKVIVGDPAVGNVLRYSAEAFLKSWYSVIDPIKGNMGMALLLEPTVEFENCNDDSGYVSKEELGFRYLVRFLKPHKKSILKIMLGMALGSFISMLFPLLTQSIVDIGIGNGDSRFVMIVLVAQFALVVGQSLNHIIKNWLMLHVTINVNISLVSNFLGKLMRLPISFYDSRRMGDTLQRIRDFDRIQNFLTGELIGISMGVIGLVVYSVMMAGYNFSILGVFAVGSALYVGWILIFMKRRRKLDYMRFQESARNESNVVQMITSMQEIKLNNCERQKLWEWEKTQNRLYDVSIKGLSLSQAQNIGGTLIDQLKNMAISFMSALLVINGDMTIGMMMSIQYIIGELNAPIADLVSFIRSYQDTKISLERLNEVQQIEDEDAKNIGKETEIPQDANIVLKNVSFQYDGPHSRKVLDDISLTIPANKTTAIVGMSGSGKTTMLKLILGFYEPVEGGVFLDDRPLGEFNVREWRRACGVVMQDGFIFSDTIANNIGVSDAKPDMRCVDEAVHIANLNDYIKSQPNGLNTFIGLEGKGLSSGQKQRVLIARAVYKNTKYIFFDEATNALDANNEQVIMKNLDNLFKEKTVIVVAHRLSTVKNADNIVVLDKGKIVEQGTHDELVRLKGNYFNLVKNQLELGM